MTRIPLLTALVSASLILTPLARAAGAVDFQRDVLPILSENCFTCHGPDAGARKAKLRLDTREGALRKSDPVIVPGKSADSELLRRVRSSDPAEVMPPPKSKKVLTAAQIAVLQQWIDQGARWSAHWAFVNPRRPSVPILFPSAKPQAANPIDAFLLAAMRKQGLRPAPEASRERLLRRVTLDLTGVPPSIADMDAFLNDTAPGAYGRLVDRLLGSPRFGERMVWEWLDAARYADSNGYQGDGDRTAWPWRDWAIGAFNANMPFDQFTVWQLAGDLLPAQGVDATRGPTQGADAPRSPEHGALTQPRSLKLATAFLRNHMINGEGGRIAEENRIDYVMDMTETVGTVWLGLTLNCCRCHDHKYDPLLQKEYYSLFAFFNQTPVTGGGGDPQTRPVVEVQPKVRVMVMEDMPRPRDTFVLTRGLYSKPGEKVQPGVPAILPPLPDGPRNRLTLARWIVSPDNPLTARVIVNRYWQQFFGVGLVKTIEDFGTQGERPINQDLLDWLAVDFRENGWDLKRLCKQIVTSAAYRQSSRITPELAEHDPDNRFVARGPRLRLPSWMIRDQALAASGLLVGTLGGPGVHPYQPPGVWEEATFGRKQYRQDHGSALYRRSVYTFWRRIIRPTMFFDVASRQTCTVKQGRTNTPLHALATLNDTTYVEAARALAERILTAPAMGDEQRVDLAFRLVLARHPTSEERTILQAGLKRLRGQYAADPAAARKLLAVGESKRNDKLDTTEHAALAALCHAILNLDEAVTKE